MPNNFHRIPNEYRMVSSDEKWELTLERTDRDGIRHFRLNKENFSINFMASLSFKESPIWNVIKIITEDSEGHKKLISTATNKNKCTMTAPIVDALMGFGTFFGQDTGQVRVAFDIDD